MPPQEAGLPNRHLSRRDFLRLAGAAIGGYALRDVVDASARWALDVPGSIDEAVILPYLPGYLETQYPNRPAFIEAGMGGHKSYLKYMASQDESLAQAHGMAFADLMKPVTRKPPLSERIFQHMQYAHKVLRYTTAPLSEVVHLSMFTMASVHSNFYTYGEVRHSFGVKDNTGKPDTKLFDITDYEGNVPHVLTDETANGIDQSFHFANFAFLKSQLKYAGIHGLQEVKRIPNLASAFASIGTTPGDQSEITAQVGQLAWEWYETRAWLKEMDHNGQYASPDTGLFDPGLERDFRANLMGTAFADLLVRKDPYDWSYVETVLAAVDSPNDLFVLASQNGYWG